MSQQAIEEQRRKAAAQQGLPSIRRSDFDITNTVRVSSPHAVLQAVEQLYVPLWPGIDMDPVRRAFAQFDDLFSGRVPGYAGVDTLYHDRQHTLDVTLTMARICVGYEQQVEVLWKLGPERSLVGVVLALFHDVGYLRRAADPVRNGAELTRTHVSRGVEFLRGYLPHLGMGTWTEVAAQVLHFTGYERPFSELVLNDARDLRLGHLLGTADMITQLADRCYLEKCRDRLYPEFVLGGMALPLANASPESVRYASGLDLLRQTPQFVNETRAKRRRVQRRLSLPRGAVRRPQPVHGIDRAQHGLPRPGAAQRELAHAPAQSAAVRRRLEHARRRARADAGLLQAGLDARLSASPWAGPWASRAASASGGGDATAVTYRSNSAGSRCPIVVRPSMSTPASASATSAALMAACAGTATGAKLRCQGSGWTPPRSLS